MATYQVMEEAKAFYYPGNDIGVLVIHGFTGSTQSMRYLGEQLAAEGHTVYGPRLAGHGTAPEDMEASSHQQWIQSVEEGLQKLAETCASIFVTGLSMGGTLTLYLAENHPEIKGIMPINAAIEMPELIETYHQLRDTGQRFVEGIGSDIKKPGIKELAYPKTPVKSMGEIIALSQKVRENLGKISAPALIFSSVEDHVVPPENSREIYDAISSENRTLILMEDSYHVATLDNDKEMIAEKCKDFIQSLL
ncbi:alpha/beta fold hydrolase [Virgibacillus sp. 179-BFC.A HS]|uniref:Alpha/beta fold hydrolase n=1 Tax=Tigheibacillus jepli TaxID=3035914 RepID=A0ABU5CJY7_9BACI|nr:alpha/beta fold hydrolase [Virgibacillus sp. 179-BFC.A HS]MDY0406152.1 alpha/beta fold hydrolase [Virgibacillus sp. 179-BFC.A HS]